MFPAGGGDPPVSGRIPGGTPSFWQDSGGLHPSSSAVVKSESICMQRVSSRPSADRQAQVTGTRQAGGVSNALLPHVVCLTCLVDISVILKQQIHEPTV
jgi:hypothetical protein